MLTKYAVHHRMVIGFCVFLIIVGGLWSYLTMGRLEDPEFTIGTALVVTLYPGASAEDVEEQVTNVIERASQQIAHFKRVHSISKPGVSFVLVDLVDGLDKLEISKIWQDLRNKISSARLELPVESLPSIVKDDFGDVYGIVLSLSGDGFSNAELRDTAKKLQKELLVVDQVQQVELWGTPEERIEVQISPTKMQELNIHPLAIILALQSQNLTTDSGNMLIGGQKIRVTPSGSFQSLEEIENLILPDGTSEQFEKAVQLLAAGTPVEAVLATLSGSNQQSQSRMIRLHDIATVERVLNDEPSKIMRANGKNAIALALSPIPNGNVIKMGELVRTRINEIMAELPVGYNIDVISYQPDNVKVAIHAFTKNLYEAVIIVTLVVMIAMGWKSGLLITSSLLIVMLGTFCVLAPMGIVLHRTSLGAFIIALGILVDDAVVVGDLILVRMQRGMDRMQACIEGAKRAAPQLLGATIVGALAFWPIYLSPDKTGEYAGTVFVVLGISLMISWLVAMMQTPVIYYLFVKEKPLSQTNAPMKDPHAGPVYQMYRRMLVFSLHHKTLVLLFLIFLLGASCYGFTYIPQIFFPRAQRTQFMIDYWLPEGSSITEVSKDVRQIEDHLLTLEGVTNVGSFIGSGPPRFYLPYEPELPNSSYAQLVVNVATLDDVDRLVDPVEEWVLQNFPQAEARAQRFALGPTTKQEVEVRVSGPDSVVLHQLADQIKEIFQKEPTARYVRDDWRQKVPTWVPEFSQSKGLKSMVSRSEMMFALRWATRGIQTATFDDNETLLPILMRATPSSRNSAQTLQNLPVWGHTLNSVPLSQVANISGISWDEGQIHRRNRFKTITIGADAKGVDWSKMQKTVQPKIEALKLPPGYHMEWGGQWEQSQKSSHALLKNLPIALIFMAIIVVILFNAIRQPLIILMTFPLAMIGITFGMLVFQKPFGFMALVGAMSLLGMMVRNGVVLMDQIDEELSKGESAYNAIVDASVERMRPVTVAAMTVIVGMIPLLQDPLFDSMATAIMFGLIFSTLLTLFIVPIFYLILFRVKLPSQKAKTPKQI